MKFYFDTSALLKGYVVETGSERVRLGFADAESITVSVLIEPELFSSLNRLRREGLVDDTTYSSLRVSIQRDLSAFQIIPIVRAVTLRAITLVERHPLRAADAIHLATALVDSCDVLWTSDRRLKAAALAEGMSVVDPCE